MVSAKKDLSIRLPAVRGIQAGREYYVVMCPLQIASKLFGNESDELPAELRAQRTLNRSRIPQLVRYVTENRDTYVFSSLAASVDAEMEFVPAGKDATGQKVGTLSIPFGARLLINDGQHRLAAIRAALKEDSDLRDETISVVLHVDNGLTRSQQMFADLNRFAVRPTRSLNILYDHRDQLALLARKLAASVPVFKGLTEMESNSISNRARKLFTLNSIYHATQKLLGKLARDTVSADDERIAHSFWSEVGKNMPEWLAAAAGEASPFELRQSRIHAHGIALQAIASAGHLLLSQHPKRWKSPLAKLSTVDWNRSNIALWEGRALSGGKICKAGNHVLLSANVLKLAMELPLTKTERNVEEIHEAGRRQKPHRKSEDHPHKGNARRAARNGRPALPRGRKAVGNRLQRR